MREEDNQIRHYVLVRRIIIVLAVLIATPVVLWTVPALVRAYVGPLKAPAVHQLAATAEPENSRNANSDSGGALQPPVEQKRLVDPAAATMETRATVTDAHELSVGLGGVPMGNRALDSDASMPTGATKTADIFAALATPEQSASNIRAAEPPQTDAAPAAAPLAGSIPLPRRRPSEIAMVRITAANVPMPRPRPDAAGATASDAPPSSSSPLDFLQNLFR